ncbi:MAG: hypothetical protein K6U88_16850, partial [Dehalococcoidia bacterium]|nr:hypothetical protein [Dehalococcoidia bacterium]
FIRQELLRRGYQPVYTPHIGRVDMYETSGHFPYYREAQFSPLFGHDGGKLVDFWIRRLQDGALSRADEEKLYESARVLGVDLSRVSLGGPPEEIGHKVAAALVGTFLGILLCYGLLGPMAAKMGKAAEEEGHFYHVVRNAITAFLKGTSPLLSVEFARRVIPGHVRPSFKELEDACRGKS